MASDDGLCVVHSGRLNLREIGRLGGRTPKKTALRREAAGADDSLREQAREVLQRALAGEDVDKQQLDAARSLFSYRADSPPAERSQNGEYSGPRIDGRRPTSLADVLTFAAELDQVSAMPELVEAARRVVAVADALPVEGVFLGVPVNTSKF